MAAKYRKIDPRIWTDERFIKLTTLEKLVALELLTGQSNRIGLFANNKPASSRHLAVRMSAYSRALVKVISTLGWQHADDVSVIFIPTWWKYNPPESKNALLGRLKDLHDVPRCELKDLFIRSLPKALGKASAWLPKGFGEAFANQEQEQEQEKDKEKRR